MDEVLRLRTEFDGAKTVKEMEALRRSTTAFRKDQLIGSQQYVQAAKLEVDVKNKLHQQNTIAYSDNAKMKESYFQLGAALRQNKFAAMQLAQSLGFDKGMLGATIIGLSGPGGAITAMIIGLSGMVTMLIDVREKAKAAAKEGLDVFLKSAEGFAPGGQQANAATIGRLKSARGDIYNALAGIAGTENTLLGPIHVSPMTETMGEKLGTRFPKDVQLRVDAMRELIRQYDAEIQKTQILIELRRSMIELSPIDVIGGRNGASGGPERNPSVEAARKYTSVGTPGQAGLGGIGDLAAIQRRNLGKSQFRWTEEVAELKPELEKISPLAQNIGNSINLYIGGALDSMIGKAGVLGNLFSQILGGLFQIGVSYLSGYVGALGASAGGAAAGGTSEGSGGDYEYGDYPGGHLRAGGGRRRLPTVGTIRGGGGRGGGRMEVVGVLRGRDILISSRRAGRSMGGSSL